MNLEDKLRDALQHDAAELVPVGPGPDHARRRAFRRKRRVQSSVVALSAVALVGGTVAALQSRPDGKGAQVHAQPGAPTSDLAWRKVDGTILNAFKHFTTDKGVTYVLSTAPGGAPNNGNAVPTDLYSTSDGAQWSRVSVGAVAQGDLAEQGGVLYGVSTGPGAQGGVDYKLSTSTDGGAQWGTTNVPVQFAPPSSSITLEPATRMQVARGAHTTVVMVEAQYRPDGALSQMLHLADGQGYRITAQGVEVIGQCSAPAVDKTGTTEAPPVRAKCEPPVLATHPWSEYGITDYAALSQQQVLVRDDGGNWQPISRPYANDAYVQDLGATSNGFVMAEQRFGDTGRGATTLYSSTDGRTWTPLATPLASPHEIAIAGDRVVASDYSSGTFTTSTDGGRTWSGVQQVSAIASAVRAPAVMQVDAGPLGFAVVAYSELDKADPKAFLLHSTDGANWKVDDLGAVGAPDHSWVAGLTVGADHIDVTFAGTPPAADPTKPAPLVTLIGTPKA